MIDIQLIRDNPQNVKKATYSRGIKIDFDKLLKIDRKLKTQKTTVDNLRAKRKQIAKLKDVQAGKKIKNKLQEEEKILSNLEDEFNKLYFSIPNIVNENVPIGKIELDNRISESKDPKKFDFVPKDHLEIAKNLKLIDFERGAKVAGTQFYYLENEAVLLEQALINYCFNYLKKENFTLIETPDLAKKRFYQGTGYLPIGPEAQTYQIESSDLGLAATAEITMAGYHADEILDVKELPKKYCAISHCFRKEAGSYGKYSKGLYRVHQFTKVEMYIYCKPSESKTYHNEIIKIEKKLVDGLNIPYREVELCSGQLGSQSAITVDLEANFPGRNDWGEITSASNTTDYQTRRLNIRYKDTDGKLTFPHSLNGTAITSSRFIVAILENYQQKDGSVIIPEVLREFMGIDKIVPKSY